MKTAHLTTAARPAITSTAGALSDRELLRETSNLVRHERHLQGAIIDHLAEIEARGLYLERGFSSLFDYAVRELGYSDAAAARQTPRRPYRCPPPSRSRRRWCWMRRGGRSWWRRRPARAPGRSARCWPTWTRSWRRRPTGCARSATAGSR